MKKSKLMAIACCGVLALAGLSGLTGCGEKHTHDYSAPYYTVEGEGESAKAYIHKVCKGCSEETEKTLVENAIIATPNTAQSVLDGEINGKVVVFDAGEYGALEIRPSVATSAWTAGVTNPTTKVYTCDSTDYRLKGEEVDSSTTLSTTGTYHYERTIQNVTLAGAEGAEFKGILAFESQKMISNAVAIGMSDSLSTRYDPFRGHALPTSSAGSNTYISHVNISNMKITRMNFDGEYARIYANYSNYDSKVEGLSVTECSFTTEERFKNVATIQLHSNTVANGPSHKYRNLVFENNIISGGFQGIYVQCVNGINILGNQISNTVHNAIALQASDSLINEYVTGNINIKNNTFKDITDRAIRLNTVQNAALVVKNNAFTNSGDEDGELLRSWKDADSLKSDTKKPNTTTNATFEFKGNTYNGVAIEDIVQNVDDLSEKTFVAKAPASA